VLCETDEDVENVGCIMEIEPKLQSQFDTHTLSTSIFKIFFWGAGLFLSVNTKTCHSTNDVVSPARFNDKIPLTAVPILVFQSAVGDGRLAEPWECVTANAVESGVEIPTNPLMVILGRA
jgi:hypothetical protein